MHTRWRRSSHTRWGDGRREWHGRLVVRLRCANDSCRCGRDCGNTGCICRWIVIPSHQSNMSEQLTTQFFFTERSEIQPGSLCRWLRN